MTGIFFSALVLAFSVEALLEYVLGIWWAPLKAETRKRVVMAAGLVVGIGLALSYRVDLLHEMGLPASVMGQVVTGAIIGRGAEYLHAFYKRLKP